MLIDGAGQVRLFIFCKRILKRRQRKRALGLRNEGRRSIGYAFMIVAIERVLTPGTSLCKRLSHQVSIMRARVIFVCSVLARPKKIELFAHIKIAPAPPARDGWRIMR